MIDNVYPRIALNKDIVEGFDFIPGDDIILFAAFRRFIRIDQGISEEFRD